MPIAHSKLTAQGQISVPAKVRAKLGVGPGSVLEWDEEGELVVVRRVGKYSSADINRTLFPASARRHILSELKQGVRRYMKRRARS